MERGEETSAGVCEVASVVPPLQVGGVLTKPSREEAEAKRKATLMHDKEDKLLPLTASPSEIGAACLGVGIYMASVRAYCIICMVLSLFFLYPLVINIKQTNWSPGWTLYTNYSDSLVESMTSCRFMDPKTISTIIGSIPRSTPGAFCLNNGFSSALACPSVCIYNEAVSKQKPLSPTQAADLGLDKATDLAESCIRHLPFCNSRDPQRSCNCCQLSLDTEKLKAYPISALVVMLLSQAAFLAWLLVLWRMQIQTAETINRNTVTLPDYTVWVKGLPRTCTDNRRVAEFFRHYGEVVSASVIISIGNVVKPARNIGAMRNTLQELRAKAALDEGMVKLDLADGNTGGCCFGFWKALYWWTMTGFGSAREAANALEKKIEAELVKIRAAEELTTKEITNVAGEALVTMNYEAHKKNALIDHKQTFNQKLWAKLKCQSRRAPTFDGAVIQVSRAPEPSDYLWENTSISNRRIHAVFGWVIFLVAVVLACAAQYFLAAEAEKERIERLVSSLERSFENENTDLVSSISQTVTRSYVSWSYGFVVTLLNIIVSLVQGWTSTNVEKWSTVSDREASDNVKISMFYIVNSFVIPLLAAYVQFDAGKDLDQFEVEADGQALWYIEGGVVTSLFWIQVFNCFLGDILAIFDPFRLANKAMGRHSLTQAQMDRRLALPPASISSRYASAVKTLALGILCAPILPISPILSLIGLLISYWTDKVLFLRLSCRLAMTTYKITKAINRLLLYFPLMQLLLMRFLYFQNQPGMQEVFIAGIVFWLLMVFLPIRAVLGIRREEDFEDDGTAGQSYQDTLGTQKQDWDGHEQQRPNARPVPSYRPPISQKTCSNEFWQVITEHFANESGGPLPPNPELLPNQLDTTGADATRAPAGSRMQEAAPIDPGTLQHQSDGVTEVGFVNPYLAGFFAHTPAPLPTPTPPLFINPYRDPQAQPGFDPPLLPRV